MRTGLVKWRKIHSVGQSFNNYALDAHYVTGSVIDIAENILNKTD